MPDIQNSSNSNPTPPALKIFVVNKAGHSIDAARHSYPTAEIIELSEGVVNVFDIPGCLATLREAFKNSSPGDLLLLSGGLPLNVLAVLMFAELHDRVNLLLWHAKREVYMLRMLERKDLI